MNKRFKILLIITAVIFVAALSLWLINLKKQKQEASSTSQKTISSETPGQLPTGVKIPDYSIRVDGIKDDSQIKASFQKYVNQNPDDFPTYKKEGISMDSPISGKTGQSVDLLFFLSSVGANINPEIKNLVGSNYYGMFYCINKDKQKEFGIALDIGGSASNNLQKENSEAKESMKKWEPYMLKDLHSIVFPLDNISEEDLNQALSFKDGEFRFVDITIAGEKKSVDYTVKTDEGNSVNRIYITTSQSCLKKALANLFDY